MHRAFVRTFLLIGLLPVALLAAANYLIDPFQIFQTGLLPDVGATEERYLKIEFLKRNPGFDTFLLGGSRMGTTAPADVERILPGTHVYNFFVSSGNQTDNLLNGSWLIRNQAQLKTLYVQVDWPESLGTSDFNPQYAPHPEVLGKSAAGFSAGYLFLMSYHAFDFKIQNNTGRRGEFKLPLESGHFYYPGRDALLRRDCGAYVRQSESLTAPVAEEPGSAKQRALIDASLGELKQLAGRARARGVRLELFVTPHHHRFLDRINLADYEYFLGKLAGIAPYWNFGFYSDITLNDCNYYESSHYVRSVAPRLFSAMAKGENTSFARRVGPQDVAGERVFIEKNFAAHRAKAAS